MAKNDKFKDRLVNMGSKLNDTTTQPPLQEHKAVSYTHLDVYKRQGKYADLSSIQLSGHQPHAEGKQK